MEHQGDSAVVIQTLKTGDQIDGFFIIRKKDLKTKKDQTYFLTLELGDSSGRISAIVWNDAQIIYNDLNIGEVVKVKGSVTSYQNSLQISVEDLRKAQPLDDVAPQDFIARTDLDSEQMKKDFYQYSESIQNPYLKMLIQRFFENQEILKKFTAAPGGKLWHHAYIGGLLEHTLTVVRICEEMARCYPQVDRDLLVAGAIFHDIGKMDEYRFDQGFIDFSDEGRLWGHITIGAQSVKEIIEELENQGNGFPSDIKKRLIHMILSHQGALEHGSPVVPMTLESIILYYADEMDSKANGMMQIMKKEKEPGRLWSKYVPLLERFIYFGEEENNQNSGSTGDLFD